MNQRKPVPITVCGNTYLLSLWVGKTRVSGSVDGRVAPLYQFEVELDTLRDAIEDFAAEE